MTRPLIIGVAGGTGSGKTTVVHRIMEALGDTDVTVLAHDRYYRDFDHLLVDDHGRRNYDHPDSLDTAVLVTHLRALRGGQPADLPVYDRSRHMRESATMTVQPGPAVIVEGILVFADSALRSLMDVKVFVDTDADIRFIRRLRRDIAERGRTVASVIEQYFATVKPMHLEFVEPSKRHADVIVPEGGYNQVAVEMLLTLIRSLAASR
jgi:uridine kinase